MLPRFLVPGTVLLSSVSSVGSLPGTISDGTHRFVHFLYLIIERISISFFIRR